jgi:CheY-like chemotaxis protein
MDHKMPDMDGFEATMRIRKMGIEDGYCKDVPIIALTANAISGIREDFLKNGFNDFMSKPIDTVKLDFILEKWLPKSKQKRVSKESDEDAPAIASDTAEEIDIEGINAEKGVLLSGGSVELFYETLAIYYRDGREKINEIKNCLKNGDLKLYTIHVHALKSASANVGANELSEAAALLEEAGDRGDVSHIETYTPGFLTALDLLLERINGVLEERKHGNENPHDMEQLRPVLVGLKAALEVLDAGKINKSIQELQETTQASDIADVITNISDKILFGEYDEAAAMIDELLQSGRQ